MALLIREEDVRALLTPAEAVDLVDEVFRLEARGDAVNRPRVRIPYHDGLFHSMSGAVPARQAVGLKCYASGRRGAQFVVLLFETESNTLLAILEADWLGRMRTGAASGVATRHMARKEACVLGVIGAGSQAQTQIEAIAAVRSLEHVKIFSRTSQHREALARRMSDRLNTRVTAVGTAEETVRESDVVVTITTTREPVFQGEWLEDGTHVNAAGSNQPGRREIDHTTVERSAVVAVDSLQQSQAECGDLILAAEEGAFEWSQAVELAQIVSGRVQVDHSGEGISLFESQGIAIEDIVVARHVYDKAVAAGRGQHIDLGSRSE